MLVFSINLDSKRLLKQKDAEDIYSAEGSVIFTIESGGEIIAPETEIKLGSTVNVNFQSVDENESLQIMCT